MFLLPAFAVTTFASAETAASKMSQAMEDAETKLYDLMDKDINSVSFAKGGFALSENETRSLRAVYKSVLRDDSVKKVIVAAWADREGIRAGEKLSDADVALADKRTDAVKKVLTEVGAKNFELHNMAQDATWIAKTFKTRDAAVKEAMKKGNAKEKDTEVNAIVRLLEEKGGAGKAVVIVARSNSFSATTR